MSGYYTMHRGAMDHPVFAKEPYTEYQAFEWLVSEAAYKARRFRIGNDIADLERGQLAASLRWMCKAWRWKSDKRVRGFLSRLEAENMISIGKIEGKKWTQLTICNYDKYQSEGRSKDADGTQQGRNTKKVKTSSLRSEDNMSSADANDEVFDTAVSEWLAAAKRYGWTGFRTDVAAFQARKAQIKERLKEFGIDGWRAAIRHVAANEFFSGPKARHKMNIETFVRPAKFEKYATTSSGKQAPEGFKRVGGQLLRNNNTKPNGGAYDDRGGSDGDGGSDWPEASRDGQPADDMSDLLPVETEENGTLSFGDHQPGGGAAALPPLRMECRV